MNYNANFIATGESVCAAPYEYKECGLKGIYLINGYDVIEHEGEKYVAVADTEGLNRRIGEFLVARRKELSADEVRFLRKTMDLTQSELGRWMGKDSQTVARWEKGQTAIPAIADRLLRAIFQLKTMAPEERGDFLDLLRNIDDMDDITPCDIEIYLNDDGRWQYIDTYPTHN